MQWVASANTNCPALASGSWCPAAIWCKGSAPHSTENHTPTPRDVHLGGPMCDSAHSGRTHLVDTCNCPSILGLDGRALSNDRFFKSYITCNKGGGEGGREVPRPAHAACSRDVGWVGGGRKYRTTASHRLASDPSTARTPR